MTDDGRNWYENLRIDLDPDRIDESLKVLGEKLKRAWDQGRYTRVRFMFKGKAILPDIPLGALVATEVATFWWAGPVRALVANFGIKSFLDVEFLHAADDKVRDGQEHYLAGEIEAAEEDYREALRMRPGDVSALYNLGVLLRVSGRKAEALEVLEQAARESTHPDGIRAREMLTRIGG
jgi:tetratricopeptide (TPR) repeat protein